MATKSRQKAQYDKQVTWYLTMDTSAHYRIVAIKTLQNLFLSTKICSYLPK